MALSGAAVLAVVLGVAAPASAVTVGAAAQGASGGGTAASFKITPKSLDFGAQEIGTTSAAQTMTVTNTGSTEQEVGGFLPTGVNFTQYTQTPADDDSGAGCSDVFLAPGASCSVSFTFSPELAGPQPFGVDLQVFTPGGLQTAATATVTGRGTFPGAYIGSITVPSAVAQNGVTGGQSVTATVSVSNTVGGPCVTFKEPITVNLVSVPFGADSVPSQVVVPAGQCTANFTIGTAATTVQEEVGVTGIVASDPKNGTDPDAGVSFTVNP
jgi:hypothetical protein